MLPGVPQYLAQTCQHTTHDKGEVQSVGRKKGIGRIFISLSAMSNSSICNWQLCYQPGTHTAHTLLVYQDCFTFLRLASIVLKYSGIMPFYSSIHLSFTCYRCYFAYYYAQTLMHLCASYDLLGF